MRIRWCTSKLKTDVFKKYSKQKYGKDYIKFVGIAYEETDRWNKNQNTGEAIAMPPDYREVWHSNTVMTAVLIGAGYIHFDRVSCWCCPLPNQRNYLCFTTSPQPIGATKDMDSQSWNQFKRDYSVLELEEKFRKMKPVMQVSLF